MIPACVLLIIPHVNNVSELIKEISVQPVIKKKYSIFMIFQQY